jgi:hypothetical protein
VVTPLFKIAGCNSEIHPRVLSKKQEGALWLSQLNDVFKGESREHFPFTTYHEGKEGE